MSANELLNAENDPSGVRRYFSFFKKPGEVKHEIIHNLVPVVIDLTGDEYILAEPSVPSEIATKNTSSQLVLFEAPQKTSINCIYQTPVRPKKKRLRAGICQPRVLNFDIDLAIDRRETIKRNEITCGRENFNNLTLAHRGFETDKHNMLYNLEFMNFYSKEPGGDKYFDESSDDSDWESVCERRLRRQDTWHFTSRKSDVLKALSHYEPKNNMRKKLTCTKEVLKGSSSFSCLSTRKKCPVVIYFNQMFRPEAVTKDDLVVARCTFTENVDGRVKTCKGSIYCSQDTGEVVIHEDCTHDSRRDYIALELIDRRLAIMELSGCPKERLYEVASQQAEQMGVSEKLAGNEQISRRITGKNYGQLKIGFPPSVNWVSFENVICLADTSGLFKSDKSVLMAWKVNGVEKWLGPATKTIHIDGKFSEVPSNFKQIYVICTQNTESGKTVPLIFALLTNATRETYRELFEIAKDGGLNPDFVYSDYETTAMNAASDTWPNITKYLCWRHFKCSLKRNLIGQLGTKLANTSRFERLLKAIYSLCFAPIDRVKAWFYIMRARTHHIHHKLPDYFKYLESTYFGANSTYKAIWWNCYQRAHLGKDYSNNASESVYARYSRIFHHNDYHQLNVAIGKSVRWAQEIYRNELTGRVKLNRTKGVPLYKNNHFIANVKKQYQTLDDFIKRIYLS